MKNTISLIFIFISLVCHAQLPEKYNVTWRSQSKNSSESMPLGGHSIGLNVWVEKDEILFYMAQSGAFDENNQLLKLGRCRLKLSPNPFSSNNESFEQELHINTGHITISNSKIAIKMWVEVHQPNIHIEINSKQKVDATLSYESWRTKKRYLPMSERTSCYSYSEYPDSVFTYKYRIQNKNNEIIFYHRNNPQKLLFDYIVKQQKLTSVKDKLDNTQKGNTFGGIIKGKGIIFTGKNKGSYANTPYQGWNLKSKNKKKHHKIQITLLTKQSKNIKDWKNELLEISNSSKDLKKRWNENTEWWKDFWNRSYILINLNKSKDDKGFQMGKNYQLFRYMLGCNAYGKYPTKFNGGLFTFDPIYVIRNNKGYQGTPDFRCWGGGSHTAQNQRLVYWPMLKSGDFELMKPQFNFYLRGLNNAELRTKEYWGHEGCSFTEHPETFGLPAAATWGFKSGKRKRPDDLEKGILCNQWVKYHYTNQLEFSYMILKYWQYSKHSINRYLPFIRSSLNFFFEHYQFREYIRNKRKLDENGKLVIYPSTACETFKNVKNPTDISAAIKSNINYLLRMPDSIISQNEKEFWKKRLRQVPNYNYKDYKGKRIIVAAEDLPKNINTDIPELYLLFPYSIITLEDKEIKTAINTWKSGLLDNRKNYISWHQDGIFCAKMGLINEALEITQKKLSDGPYRFPAFWGPGHDYSPDHNWGGSGMIGLQEMLLQENKGIFKVLPCWPKSYNVRFKLHGSNRKTIEIDYKNGTLNYK